MTRALKPLLIVIVLIGAWQTIVSLAETPHYILPGPLDVLAAARQRRAHRREHRRDARRDRARHLFRRRHGRRAGHRAGAIVRDARLAPALIVGSQAIPVFALAPLLVLWMGYGLASKIAMAALIIFFPVAMTAYDGLRRIDPAWAALARTMTAGTPAPRWRTLRYVELPAAMPAFASGLRVAVSVAPIGAVLGEWVGADAGLGYLMMDANRRVAIPLMFACLIALAGLGVALYLIADTMLNRFIPWRAENEETI